MRAFALTCALVALAGGTAYAADELCQACHEDVVLKFKTNPHKKGCESCHGPGDKHAETAEKDKIFSFTAAPRQKANEQCLSCHAGQQTQHGRLLGAHDRNSLSCLDCHSVHQSAAPHLMTASTDNLCGSCHLNVKAEFNRPYRHKLQEKAISCVDCHNPHGGPPPRSMRRASANEPSCLKCHGDKRGPFPFEHAPVRLESCAACHEPHGSANPRMLVRHEANRLCLECHASRFTRLGGAPPAFHDLRNARFQNCTICHSKIHGSFVSRDFLR
jgi:DmsE family decaheme c-type cytochrome